MLRLRNGCPYQHLNFNARVALTTLRITGARINVNQSKYYYGTAKQQDWQQRARCVRVNARVNRTTDIMERLGLVEGCLKDSEEYQRLHVDTIKEIIETCRDLYADYQMHHDPRIREVLMKEGLAFPETVEELEIFEKHNPTEDIECPISAEEMVNRITEKEKQ